MSSLPPTPWRGQGIVPSSLVREGDVATCREAPCVPEPGERWTPTGSAADTWYIGPFPQKRRSCCNPYKGGLKREMTFGFHGASLLILIAWKGDWFGFPVSFFLLGTGAVKTERLSALTLGSEGGWRNFRSLLRKHRTGSQLHSMIPSGFDKR